MSVAIELATADACAQAELVRQGEVTPVELVEAAIERIEAVDPPLNSVTTRTFELALEASRQPALATSVFCGAPVLLKDTTAAVGEKCVRGMRVLAALGGIDHRDSHVVTRLRAAGLLSLGRTNVPELASAITTESLVYGPCHNPWDLAISPGGSSGGSAAAVAAGLVPVAHGTDGGGSIRIPASMCGVVGLKPTRGRVSMGPGFSDTEGLSVPSVLTRSVRDTAAVLDRLAGAFPGDPWRAPPLPRSLTDALQWRPGSLRVGVWTTSAAGVAVHPDCVEACDQTARLLEHLGHHVEEVHPAGLDDPVPPWFFVLGTSLTAWQLKDVGRRIGRPIAEDDVEANVWAAAKAGESLTVPDYLDAVAALRSRVAEFAQWWEHWDLLVTPTLAVPPFELGATTAPSPGSPWPDVQSWIPFTPVFNYSGFPAISLPLSWNADDLPVGTQIGAGLGREDVLISVAAQLEAAQPWVDRWPPNSYAATIQEARG